eukprot:gb/GECG01012528.1/.p1 GENE.gb/GECG01012528.1/~~gb/GECG01012528.1/.p1  ORF type:complete len:1088 (+),score=155.13 gb/GECG01012528.1/:1-3264(+)
MERRRRRPETELSTSHDNDNDTTVEHGRTGEGEETREDAQERQLMMSTPAQSKRGGQYWPREDQRDLLQGTQDWINIQSVVRFTFKEILQALEAQQTSQFKLWDKLHVLESRQHNQEQTLGSLAQGAHSIGGNTVFDVEGQQWEVSQLLQETSKHLFRNDDHLMKLARRVEELEHELQTNEERITSLNQRTGSSQHVLRRLEDVRNSAGTSKALFVECRELMEKEFPSLKKMMRTMFRKVETLHTARSDSGEVGASCAQLQYSISSMSRRLDYLENRISELHDFQAYLENSGNEHFRVLEEILEKRTQELASKDDLEDIREQLNGKAVKASVAKALHGKENKAKIRSRVDSLSAHLGNLESRIQQVESSQEASNASHRNFVTKTELDQLGTRLAKLEHSLEQRTRKTDLADISRDGLSSFRDNLVHKDQFDEFRARVAPRSELDDLKQQVKGIQEEMSSEYEVLRQYAISEPRGTGYETLSRSEMKEMKEGLEEQIDELKGQIDQITLAMPCGVAHETFNRQELQPHSASPSTSGEATESKHPPPAAATASVSSKSRPPTQHAEKAIEKKQSPAQCNTRDSISAASPRKIKIGGNLSTGGANRSEQQQHMWQRQCHGDRNDMDREVGRGECAVTDFTGNRERRQAPRGSSETMRSAVERDTTEQAANAHQSEKAPRSTPVTKRSSGHKLSPDRDSGLALFIEGRDAERSSILHHDKERTPQGNPDNELSGEYSQASGETLANQYHRPVVRSQRDAKALTAPTHTGLKARHNVSFKTDESFTESSSDESSIGGHSNALAEGYLRLSTHSAGIADYVTKTARSSPTRGAHQNVSQNCSEIVNSEYVTTRYGATKTAITEETASRDVSKKGEGERTHPRISYQRLSQSDNSPDAAEKPSTSSPVDVERKDLECIRREEDQGRTTIIPPTGSEHSSEMHAPVSRRYRLHSDRVPVSTRGTHAYSKYSDPEVPFTRESSSGPTPAKSYIVTADNSSPETFFTASSLSDNVSSGNGDSQGRNHRSKKSPEMQYYGASDRRRSSGNDPASDIKKSVEQLRWHDRTAYEGDLPSACYSPQEYLNVSITTRTSYDE